MMYWYLKVNGWLRMVWNERCCTVLLSLILKSHSINCFSLFLLLQRTQWKKGSKVTSTALITVLIARKAYKYTYYTHNWKLEAFEKLFISVHWGSLEWCPNIGLTQDLWSYLARQRKFKYNIGSRAYRVLWNSTIWHRKKYRFNNNTCENEISNLVYYLQEQPLKWGCK